jgi:uroporphyrinogen decarboxylase
MRQAGRYLPEYRALKARHSFVEMVRTPELATEVTLQPMRRFPLDAAILFSDILVVPEAMGQPYHFKDGGGIAMEFVLDGAAAVEALAEDAARERLDYVPAALRLIRQALGQDRALLGFCGSPWTLATYMVEGGNPGTGARIRALCEEDPALFIRLMEKITRTCGDYLEMQIEAGVDAVQIFDSWGGLCEAEKLQDGSLRWIEALVRRVNERVPVIVFCRGQAEHLEQVAARTGAPVIAVEHGVDLAEAAARLPRGTAVQGNLDPALLLGDPETAAEATRRIVRALSSRGGHIFNLGHGITPEARVETVGAVVQAVIEFGEGGGGA